MPPTSSSLPTSSAAEDRRRTAPWSTREGSEVVLLAIAGLYVIGLGVWPLLRLLAEAFAPGADGAVLGSSREVADSGAVARALRNTLAGSVAVWIVLGAGLALAAGLLDLRGRVAMTFLILSPLLIPSQILALAWIHLLGSSSVLGPLGLAPGPGDSNSQYSGGRVVLLLGIENMPIMFLAVRAGLLSVPQTVVEAGMIAGAGTSRVLASLVLPLLRPILLSGAVLAFAVAAGNFGVPALLGIPGRFPVLTTLIYQKLNSFGP